VNSFGSTPTSVAATVTADACLSANGWLTAELSLAGVGSVSLQGTLTEVIGVPGSLGYVFRGVVLAPSDGPGSPLVAATQFVAQIVLAEPTNTAQLTVVFLSDGAAPATSATSAPSAAAAVSDTGSSQPQSSAGAVSSESVSGLDGSVSGLANLGSEVLIGALPSVTTTGMPTIPAIAVGAMGLAGAGSPALGLTGASLPGLVGAFAAAH